MRNGCPLPFIVARSLCHVILLTSLYFVSLSSGYNHRGSEAPVFVLCYNLKIQWLLILIHQEIQVQHKVVFNPTGQVQDLSTGVSQ